MSLIANGVTELMRFADYRGRSTRTDLLAFWLLTFVAGLALLVAATIFESTVFSDLSLTAPVETTYQGLLTIPLIALLARRLHDRGLSGWWVALCVPALVLNIIADYYLLTGDFEAMLAEKHSTTYFIAAIPKLVVFIFLFLPGEEGPNRYGPNPRFDQPGEPA